MSYQVERTSDEVLTIRHNDVVAGWEQWYLLVSDVHYDSIHCDRKLLAKLFDQAKERKAGILSFGDWFDAMGGKKDGRASKSDLRPEYKVNNYFDVLVDDSTDFLIAYLERLIALALGNHDEGAENHNETNLLERLVKQLRADKLTGDKKRDEATKRAGLQCMGYSGFVRFMFQSSTGNRTTRRMYFHHGSNGGGPVTKGVIQTNRRAASVHADIFVSGDIHESWLVENVVVELSDSGRIQLSTQTHCQLPTFKQEYIMKGGYHIRKGRPPKPLGGWWLVFYYDNTQPGNVGYRFERAN